MSHALPDQSSDQVSPIAANPPVIQSPLARLGARFNQLSPAKVAKLFNIAFSAGKSYALIPADEVLVEVGCADVKARREEHYAMSHSCGYDDLYLDTKMQAVRFGAGVMQSGLMGALDQGRLIDSPFKLNEEDIDLCNVFYALSHQFAGHKYKADLSRLNARLQQRQLKAFPAISIAAPDTPGESSYKAELVLAVCLIDKKEPVLFNRMSEALVPAHYGRGISCERVGAQQPPALLVHA